MNHFSLLLTLCFSVGLLFPVSLFARVPSDPDVQQPAYDLVNVYEAWDHATGTDAIVVAVIDDGFDMDHPDLADNVWRNTDEICGNNKDDDANGYVDDCYGWNFFDNSPDLTVTPIPPPDPDQQVVGRETNPSLDHATAVAGVIGAVGDNGRGTAGVNWDVRLMNLKILTHDTRGGWPNFIEAVRYAVDNGADVINMSVVTDQGAPGLIVKQIQSALAYAHEHGVILVAAAGNNSIFLHESPVFPVCADANDAHQIILGVSAVQSNRYRAGFSNYGSKCIDLTAPGVDVQALLLHHPERELTDLYGGSWHGTSMAAPFVSGAAALVKSVHPEWEPALVYDVLTKSVHKTPPADEALYAHAFGSGLLQIDKAIAIAKQSPFVVDLDRAVMHLVGRDGQLGLHYPDTGHVAQLDVVPHDDVYSVGMIGGAGGILPTVLYKKDRRRAGVTVYDHYWQPLHEWAVSSRRPERMVVGDVIGDDAAEIIIFPSYASRVAYRVYALDGTLLKTVKTRQRHRGVSLTLVYNEKSKKHEVVTVFSGTRGLAVTHYNTDFRKKRSFSLGRAFRYRASIAADRTAMRDGRLTYVIAGGSREKPVVRFYDESGTFLKELVVAKRSYRGGLGLQLVDYDKDGHADVLTTFLKPHAQPRAVVWKSDGTRLGQWHPYRTVGARSSLAPVSLSF